MRLDPDSVKKIMGNSKGAVVYGLEKCLYKQVYASLARNYKTYDYSEVKAPLVRFDHDGEKDKLDRECKSAIISLVLDNFKRSKRGEMIVPLIFCVGKQEDGETFRLNVEQMATKSGSEGSITDKELRRCFKVFAQLGPEIKMIAEQTFKFVNVRQDDKEEDLYHLDQVAPFWQDSNWNQLWQQRLAKKIPKQKQKKYFWREIMLTECRLFDHARHDRAPCQQDNFFSTRKEICK